MSEDDDEDNDGFKIKLGRITSFIVLILAIYGLVSITLKILG